MSTDDRPTREATCPNCGASTFVPAFGCLRPECERYGTGRACGVDWVNWRRGASPEEFDHPACFEWLQLVHEPHARGYGDEDRAQLAEILGVYGVNKILSEAPDAE